MSTTDEYRKLLAEYLPQPIRTQQEYKRALRQLEKLMVPNPGRAQSLLIEVFATLIEQYETREFPTPSVAPAEMLAQLIESRGETCAAIARSSGVSPATLSSALSGQRGISKSNAVRLARYFGLSPSVFLPAVEPTVPSGR